MEPELLVAGDRTTLEVLMRRAQTNASPLSLGPAIGRARLAQRLDDSEVLVASLIDVATAAIQTAARIRLQS